MPPVRHLPPALCALLCAAALVLPPARAGLSCRDAKGNAVDWFVAVKVPDYIHDNPDDGQQYFFMTAAAPAWTLSACDVEKSCGPIYNTVQQAYNISSKNATVSIIYNDELPEDGTLRWSGHWYTYGHMKGVLAFGIGGSGFWLINSVPKFPGYDRYAYPNTGLRYGQHFFCVSYPYSQLAAIARQLSIARPNVFVYNLPSWLEATSPDLASVVHKRPPQTSALSLVAALQSSAGVRLTHFSKASHFGKDLYDSLVAPSLRASLYMEGWVNGHGDISSTCNTTYRVYNVQEVHLERDDWTTTHDHSKWAISTNGDEPWVCLGDINRQYSQFKRGGGTLCFSNPTVWKAFRAMVATYEHC